MSTQNSTQSSDTSWDFAPVKETKPITYYRCQQMYWNLIKKFDKDSQIEAATFVALLAGTKRCDEIGRNLQHVREAYYSTMEEWSEGSYRNVLTNKSGDLDKDAAYRAMEDYGDWTQVELIESLSTRNKIKYHFVYRAEKTFAAIGILVTGIAIPRTAYKHGPRFIKDIRRRFSNESV